MNILYRDNTILRPLSQAHLVSRYIGLGSKTPELNKLGTPNGSAPKSAERSVADYAAQLLNVRRNARQERLQPPRTANGCGIEAPFLPETQDQLRAIAQTKADMESTRPMDRLICGDVGFGKTEVAIRAAFKCVTGGRQAAVLVPTTVLAEQHFRTFKSRMSEYPVRIEMLSRLNSAAEVKSTLEGLRTGAVDIVIGTHRLISEDVSIKNLGLVVIDEEQRFGVKHKEKFKERFKGIDVLTLSATPIPRTLYIALMGARDMSSIDTPPVNRQPVQTSVCPYDERIMKKAMERELERGGQIFLLHNRVKTIELFRDRIQALVPKARIVIGHGQMPKDELEKVMSSFVRGEADILLATTIIESGIDIPNANTIIIDRADRFGLADLYQLRGRVGRSGHRAYAYLMLPRSSSTTEDARKRVSAIKQYTELGSGFKIAMRDLEIRGAGNLLGTQQSGHIAAIALTCIASFSSNPSPRCRANARPPSGCGSKNGLYH
ncbi:MAG: DEAD/DEAH box helicase [Akkermansia sp.]